MQELEENINVFEGIKHIDENGKEYWNAREIMKVLEYTRWEKFNNVIKSVKTTCLKSGNLIDDHFHQMGKMVEIGSKTRRRINDYKLSRYACYLIAQNGDSHMKTITLARTYFAVQTRKQKLLELEYNSLSEGEKRMELL